MEQLKIDIQNLHAENDALKLAAGQMEQLKIDIQNLRAENDALKLRARRCDELEGIVENLDVTSAKAAVPVTRQAAKTRREQ